MALWTFLDFHTEVNRNPIHEWYLAQDDDVQAAFDATLITLDSIEDWTDRDVKEFKPLRKAHVGIGEIRFGIMQNRKWRRFRPVGVWRPESREFIFLLGCEKLLRGHYDPPDAFDLALTYKADLEAGRGSVHEHS